ncbi:MAG: hypothetical protein FD180_5053 [Planctomycetota bacterium]|nr:MAG: hypothetical protein FD180_5053 [Planctomycetota bacterium]
MAPFPAPADAAAPAPGGSASDSGVRGEVRENPFGARHRVAIHDGLAAPQKESRFYAALQNPAVAGALSVGVLLVAMVATLVLRGRANRLREEASSDAHGTPCSFVNAGIEFTAPPAWKITEKEGMRFSFETSHGVVSVSVLQVTGETHAERAKSFQPTGDWTAGVSALTGGEALFASWPSDAGREAGSWWADRTNHRLWVSAEGKKGICADASALFKTMKLSDPQPVEKPTDGH